MASKPGNKQSQKKSPQPMQDMIVTRNRSNFFKRKLRDKERSMKRITDLLKSPNSVKDPKVKKSFPKVPHKTYCRKINFDSKTKQSNEINSKPSTKQQPKLKSSSPEKLKIVAKSQPTEKKSSEKSKTPNNNSPSKSEQSSEVSSKQIEDTPKSQQLNISSEEFNEHIEYYPDKLKRNIKVKQIVLKPKIKSDILGSMNKRKRRTPMRGATSPLPKIRLMISSSGSTYTEEDYLSEELNIPYNFLSMDEITRPSEDEESLTEEDLLEILTCPSPVWWEDPPDDELLFLEDPLNLERPSFGELKKTTLNENKNNNEDSSETGVAVMPSYIDSLATLNNKILIDSAAFQKRSKLEGILNFIQCKQKSNENATNKNIHNVQTSQHKESNVSNIITVHKKINKLTFKNLPEYNKFASYLNSSAIGTMKTNQSYEERNQNEQRPSHNTSNTDKNKKPNSAPDATIDVESNLTYEDRENSNMGDKNLFVSSSSISIKQLPLQSEKQDCYSAQVPKIKSSKPSILLSKALKTAKQMQNTMKISNKSVTPELKAMYLKMMQNNVKEALSSNLPLNMLNKSNQWFGPKTNTPKSNVTERTLTSTTTNTKQNIVIKPINEIHNKAVMKNDNPVPSFLKLESIKPQTSSENSINLKDKVVTSMTGVQNCISRVLSEMSESGKETDVKTKVPAQTFVLQTQKATVIYEPESKQMKLSSKAFLPQITENRLQESVNLKKVAVKTTSLTNTGKLEKSAKLSTVGKSIFVNKDLTKTLTSNNEIVKKLDVIAQRKVASVSSKMPEVGIKINMQPLTGSISVISNSISADKSLVNKAKLEPVVVSQSRKSNSKNTLKEKTNAENHNDNQISQHPRPKSAPYLISMKSNLVDFETDIKHFTLSRTSIDHPISDLDNARAKLELQINKAFLDRAIPRKRRKSLNLKDIAPNNVKNNQQNAIKNTTQEERSGRISRNTAQSDSSGRLSNSSSNCDDEMLKDLENIEIPIDTSTKKEENNLFSVKLFVDGPCSVDNSKTEKEKDIQVDYRNPILLPTFEKPEGEGKRVSINHAQINKPSYHLVFPNKQADKLNNLENPTSDVKSPKSIVYRKVDLRKSNNLITKKDTMASNNKQELRTYNNIKLFTQNEVTNDTQKVTKGLNPSFIIKGPLNSNSKKSIYVSDTQNVNYCHECSSIFETEECTYCKIKSRGVDKKVIVLQSDNAVNAYSCDSV